MGEHAMKPHKHADLIHAWADGAEIQWKWPDDDEWTDSKDPQWMWNDLDIEFRIKPEPKPDVEWFAECYLDNFNYQKVPQLTSICQTKNNRSNIKLTFDGETGKIKSVEVME